MFYNSKLKEEKTSNIRNLILMFSGAGNDCDEEIPNDFDL